MRSTEDYDLYVRIAQGRPVVRLLAMGGELLYDVIYSDNKEMRHWTFTVVGNDKSPSIFYCSERRI